MAVEPAPPFIHPAALCESAAIGSATRVWAFAHVLPGARIGAGCNICDGVFVENDVLLGDRVTVKCGVQLWDGITIEDDVFIGPNATFTNDPFPRSRRPPAAFSRTIVRRGASIGANATILPGIEIGAGAMVGAGSVVTRSVPPNAIVSGNPAGIVGYADLAMSDAPEAATPGEDPIVPLGVGEAALYRLRRVADLRGDLAVSEFDDELPFSPVRMYSIFNVPTRDVRGQSAHRACRQFMIAMHGTCRLLLDNGQSRRNLWLDRPDTGVYVPAMTWTSISNFSADCVLLVLNSHRYDAADYIRSYGTFLELAKPPI